MANHIWTYSNIYIYMYVGLYMYLYICIYVLILELKEAQIGLESEKIGLLEAKERCVYHFIYVYM